MFLRGLNQNQKSLFLALAMEATVANNIVEESERQLLLAYADEMGIDVSAKSNLPLEDLLVNLKEDSTQKELNQIMFELVGMIVSDSEYDGEEKEFMKKVSSALDISQEKIDSMLECVNAYKEVIKKINFLIYD